MLTPSLKKSIVDCHLAILNSVEFNVICFMKSFEHVLYHLSLLTCKREICMHFALNATLNKALQVSSKKITASPSFRELV